MFRRDLIVLLQHHAMSVHEIATELGLPLKEVEADLQHLLRSLAHQPFRARIIPARCKKCGFVFHGDKLHKPSRCPRCKGNWIDAPRIYIEKR